MIQSTLDVIKYGFNSRRAWWFTATSRSRARFTRTVIGSYWLGIANLIFCILLGSVYGVVFKVPNPKEYFIYLGLGFSIWSSISGSLNSSPTIFSINSENIKNLKINPVFYVLEEWAFQIQTFCQSFIIIILFLAFLSPIIVVNLFVFTPIHILNLFLLLLWLPLLICLSASRFQDIYQLIPIFTQLIFLLSPIFYYERDLGYLSKITDYNILYKILGLLRDSITKGEFHFRESLIILFANLLMIIFSFSLFNKLKKNLIFYL